MPSRTLLIHSAFAAVFVVMAVFAIATASGTTSAWKRSFEVNTEQKGR